MPLQWENCVTAVALHCHGWRENCATQVPKFSNKSKKPFLLSNNGGNQLA